MKTEKIIVNSLQEAVEELKRTYGDNAVVLSSRIVKRKRWSLLPFFKTTLLEVTVGIPDEEGEFQKEFEEKIKVYEELERLKSTLSEVMKNVRSQDEEKETSRRDVGEGLSMRAQRVLSRMVYRGVRKDVARRLVEEACGYDIELGKLDFKEEIYPSLMESFRKNIVIEGERVFRNTPRIMVLIGPTGVGKTTTIAKLSYLFKRAGKRPGVITLDSYRVGAVEQLRAFINIMELPFRVADTPEEFLKSLEEMDNRDLILVDTAGRSQHDRLRLNELKLFLESAETQIYLTLSANLSELVMYEVIMQFGMFPIKGLIFSKLDETSYPGNVINVAYRTKLPILCFTTGQTVPDDIVMADYEYLTKLMLEEKHELESAGNSPEA
ncbi:flagellar biosynthesis protein FlhF [Hydrogenivirga sp. 128-5-R1-1]|uniref:flagellar biosynthesis protein FlhF n=1 Tax=Hydrogenivirga sp. 128-5-R1-1 TaxID=392423 RepID=UPI00015F16CA|nr:flagellar biosynthesis protein FlhF [Hydrogenivirga sp. 128-5-R1-1]EDP76222.1 flagellar biosynthesis FlhF [Hydrogenivirga sp. 128-5-R1-1]